MPSPLGRLAAWLCLALALFTGLAPAQGIVLCLEPDGCVSLDLAAAAEHCSCCEVHAPGALPQAGAARVLDDEDCACVDVAVCGPAQSRWSQPRSITPQMGAWIPPCADPLRAVLVPPAPEARAARAEVPRPKDSLALIRSVVLLL